MPLTVKQRIESIANTLGTIYRGLVFASAIVSVLSHEYEAQEEKMLDHLEQAKMHIGMVEAELMTLAALIEDGHPTED